MTAFIVYTLSVGAFAAVAARLIELSQANVGAARRFTWLAAIVVTLAVPPLATWFATPAVAVYSLHVQSAGPVAASALVPAPVAAGAPTPNRGFARLPAADDLLTTAWLASSAIALAWLGVGAWRLSRRARGWRAARIDAAPISVAPDMGPAVYGWRAPRIVFPAWLLTAPAATQRFALAHERAHLAARDPQVLAFATLLTALMPWNLPLLWMLRRLRFAMEVDCDARVLRAGADAADYGDALLYVSQRQARAPVAALALIERPSQLERRITIMFSTQRHPALAAGLAVLALACIAGAAQLDAPQRTERLAVKPPPTGPDFKMGPIFEREFDKRWPGIFDENAEGTNVIIALVNPDLTITKAARVTSTEKPDDVGADTGMFLLIGVPAQETAYTAIMGMQSPKHPDRRTMVVYTERKTEGEPFVSHVFQDTRPIDRDIARREFGDALRAGVPAGTRVWVLFDRNGRVLRKGIEAPGPGDFNESIAVRFPGVKIAESTWSPLVDDKNVPLKDLDGHELQLDSLWLAPGSPLPKD